MAGRLIVLDEGFPPELAGELAARGRPATTVAALGVVGATDAEVLAAVAAREGVLVVLHDLRVRVPPAPVALVLAGAEAARRDAVHRHAAAIAAQRRAAARYV